MGSRALKHYGVRVREKPGTKIARALVNAVPTGDNRDETSSLTCHTKRPCLPTAPKTPPAAPQIQVLVRAGEGPQRELALQGVRGHGSRRVGLGYARRRAGVDAHLPGLFDLVGAGRLLQGAAVFEPLHAFGHFFLGGGQRPDGEAEVEDDDDPGVVSRGGLAGSRWARETLTA